MHFQKDVLNNILGISRLPHNAQSNSVDRGSVFLNKFFPRNQMPTCRASVESHLV